MTGDLRVRPIRSVPRSWPDPARWARTVVTGAGGLVVRGVALPAQHVLSHTLTDGGDLLLAVPAGTGLARLCAAPRRTGGSPIAVVEAVDLCPLGVPDRVRGHVFLAGPIRPADPGPGHELLRRSGGTAAGTAVAALGVQAVGCSDPAVRGSAGRRERIRVPLDGFLAADPDPLHAVEPALLAHLAGAHGAELDRLAAFAGLRIERGPAGPAGAAVVPLALDCHGLTLRAGRLVRLDWAVPVRHRGELAGRLATVTRAILHRIS